MKTRIIIIALVVILAGVVAYFAVSGRSPTPNATKSSNQAGTATSQPQVLPNTTGNPIANNSVDSGFQIVSAVAENNTDITGKIVNDHLEVTLKNTTTKDINQFEVYYGVKDPTANVSEAYYTKLTGFVLKAGETKAFHFDNTGEAGHYPENNYSLYRTSKNAMQIDVTVSAPSYKVQTITIKKDKGGAEKTD